MGEHIEADLTRLRAAVGSMRRAADELDRLTWPTLTSGALVNSETERTTVPGTLAARGGGLAAALQDWAAGAAAAAAAFDRTEQTAADRFTR